jgi:hypothetical protein
MILSFSKYSQQSRLQHFPIHPSFYSLYGVYLLVMHSYLSYQQILIFNSSVSDSSTSHTESSSFFNSDPSVPDSYSSIPYEEVSSNEDDDTETMMRRHQFSYLFYNGRWSLADAMVYVLLCFNTTLRFGQSASISGFYILGFTILPFLLQYPFHASSSSSSFGHEYSLLLTPSIFIIFTFYLLCLVSSQDIEMKLRYRFLKLSELGHALRRRDTLINSILPKEISVALRKGDTLKLSAYYQHVTILFCSIVDFGRHSSSSHAEVSLPLLLLPPLSLSRSPSPASSSSCFSFLSSFPSYIPLLLILPPRCSPFSLRSLLCPAALP